MASQAQEGGMTDPLAPCRTCFWSAEITRKDVPVWCSHEVHHGWHRAPACEGKAYRIDTRPPSVPRPDEQ